MATKMNLWSLTLLPGEKYPMYIRRDFVLTNAALGEDLRSNDGRSVVKVTHQPLPPHFGDDSDSEFDSDLDIDDDEELDEDEFELDEEEGFKLTPKKGKAAANGEAMDEDDEEEEDEEEDEDDEDFSDDEEVEETNVICSLTAGKTEQTSLDLTFVAGDAVMFEVTGENAVHLLGNYIYQPGAEDSDDESDFDDEHDDYSDLELDSEDEDFDEEEAPAGKITEITETAPKAAAKPKAKVEAAPAATENKKRKADAIESPAPKAAAAEESTEGLSKAQKKKLAKKTKRESEGAAPAAAASPAQEKKPEVKKDSKIKKLPNGLIIEDVTVGDGPIAKTGKRLGMRYIGKLENGKQFDANTSGKAFTFVLGRGEVIKGWDQGLVGMHVGGERRLTIPAPLAYGNQKLPGIPKGSTLKFDVKLVSVN